MNGVWLCLLLQATVPLVGDTVWVDRDIAAPAGSLLRPLPWEPGDDAALLGAPEAVPRPGGWTLRYPLAFWRPGVHRLTIPGPLVIRPDGATDTIPARVVQVTIGSVLPAGRADTLSPRPAVGLVSVRHRSVQPAVVLLLLAGAILLPLHWWWRRATPWVPRRAGTTPAVLPGPALLAAWAEAGELRVAAEGWIAWLETAPPAPDRDQLLRALRAARFESGDRETLARLCAEAASR